MYLQLSSEKLSVVWAKIRHIYSKELEAISIHMKFSALEVLIIV